MPGRLENAEVDMEGLEDVVVVGVADWKSSKSSSSVAALWREPSPPRPLSLLLLEANSFGGVSGGTSSSNDRKSTSGSLGFGGSAFLTDADAEGLALLRGVAPDPSSSCSSYSSKRSLLELVSWKSGSLPPNPPPSPYTPPL